MFVTVINDCLDDNAFGRQLTKIGSFFNCTPVTVGVKNDLEAAGNLIDMLDAGEGKDGVILVNVAPRNGNAKKWPNGTPFGYFYYQQTLVISSIDGLTLSLVKKLHLTDTIKLLDIPTVINYLKQHHQISGEEIDHIEHTQFRSLEFIPRVAKWLHQGITLPTTEYNLTEVTDAPNAIWWIDNFGNCKTTLLADEIDFVADKNINLKVGKFNCYDRLKDVPDNQQALIIGSSGLPRKKFLEIVMQGQSVAKALNLASGQQL